MDKKICTKCNNEFPATNEYFNLRDKVSRKLQPQCKECHRESSLTYYQKNKKQVLDNVKKWRKANPNKVAEYTKRFKEANPNKYIDKRKEYYKVNKEKILKVNAKWRSHHIEEHKEMMKKWWNEHRDKNREYKRQLRTTLKGNLNSRMSRAIHHALGVSKNGRKWESLVGYTCEQLQKHLEKLFVNGMTWENYGEWHIDHKIPKSVFNYTKPEHRDFKRCWALSNLQPLWAEDNWSKNDKLNKPFQPSLQFQGSRRRAYG